MADVPQVEQRPGTGVSRRRLLVLMGLAVPTSVAALARCQPWHRSTPDALTSAVLDELMTFVGWLRTNGVRGYIGEVGWPDDTRGDGFAWNSLAEAWYAAADEAQLWVTAWASGEWWPREYRLTAYYGPPHGGAVDTPNTQAQVLERHSSTEHYLRGVSVAGGSFGAAGIEVTSSFSNEQRGTYGVDYHYPSEQTLRFLASRAIELVRIDFRWERIQPTLYAPLDADELRELNRVIDQANAAGLKVLLDLHNYGSYFLFDGQQGVRQAIGGASVPLDALADVWQRISAAFKDGDGIAAYGLMNEPANLAGQYVPRVTFEGWDDGGQRWIADASDSDVPSLNRQYAKSGSTGMRVDKTFPQVRGYGHFRVYDDGASLARVPQLASLGNTLGCWVYLPADAPGTQWQARIFLYAREVAVDSNTSVGLARGQWTLITGHFDQRHLRDARAVGVQVYANDVTGAAWIAVDDFSIGAEVRPAELWEKASQMTVDAIREQGDRQLVMVSGYGWSRPQDWFEHHPKAWIRDSLANVRYEAHHYWDRDWSGLYSESYEREVLAARTSTS